MPPARWYVKVAALAIAIIAITGVDAYLLIIRERVTPVDVTEAVERYRTPPAGHRSVLSSPQQPGQGEAASREAQLDTTTAPAGSGREASGSAPPTTTTATAAPAMPVLRPDPGVYVYATDGYEEVSLFNTRRDYPDETTRTIRHEEGCRWHMRITFLEEHEEEHLACSTTTRIEVLASSTSVEWFGHRQDNSFECDPPQRLADRDAAPGTTTEFVCREGDRTTFEGTVAYVREEAFTIDGDARAAWRIDVSSTATGEIRGSVEVDQLIDQTTGHVLWEHRRDELDQDTQAGTIHYSQDVTSTLTDLEPRT